MESQPSQVDHGEIDLYNPVFAIRGSSVPVDSDLLRFIEGYLSPLSPSALALLDRLLAALESDHPAGLTWRTEISRVELARYLGKARLTPGDLRRLAALNEECLTFERWRLLPGGGKLCVYRIDSESLVPLVRALRGDGAADALYNGAVGAERAGAADELPGGAADELSGGAADELPGGAAAADELPGGVADELDELDKLDELDAAALLKAERVAAAEVAFEAEYGWDVPSPVAARIIRARKPARRWRGLRAWQVAALVVMALAVVVLVVLAVVLALR